MTGRLLQDHVLLYLAVSVVILLGLVVLFAIATVALRVRNKRRAARWNRLESIWQPMVFDLLAPETALVADRALRIHLLWKQVGRRDVRHFVTYLTRVVGRVRGEARNTVIELAGPFVDDLARRWRKGTPEDRAETIQVLGAVGLPEHDDVVITALDDPSPLVAMVAARALMKSGNSRYLRAVLFALPRFEAWSSGFITSMLASAGPDAAAELRSQLADPAQPAWVRAVFADALAQLRDFSAADTAAGVLEREKDRELRAACLRLLGIVGRRHHLPLIRKLCGVPDFVVRTQAVAALSRLGEEVDLSILRRALSDRSPWVALQAAWGLKRLKATGILTDVAASTHPRADLARQVLAAG